MQPIAAGLPEARCVCSLANASEREARQIEGSLPSKEDAHVGPATTSQSAQSWCCTFVLHSENKSTFESTGDGGKNVRVTYCMLLTTM